MPKGYYYAANIDGVKVWMETSAVLTREEQIKVLTKIKRDSDEGSAKAMKMIIKEFNERK